MPPSGRLIPQENSTFANNCSNFLSFLIFEKKLRVTSKNFKKNSEIPLDFLWDYSNGFGPHYLDFYLWAFA